MLHKQQFKNLVIDVLIDIDLNSEHAVNLILGTAAQESAFGHYLKQLGKGPAIGIFQMEPATFNFLVNYLQRKPILRQKIIDVSGISEFKVEYLKFNLAFAIAMARVRYLIVPEKLPTTIDGYAKYWKKYYNSILGKGTEIEFIHNYKKYVL